MHDHWTLDPEVRYLNHGSFGATPRAVLEVQRALQRELEQEPVLFLAPERELEPKIDAVRARLAAFLKCRFEDLAFVRNATDGVGAVLRSFPFEAEDEIVVTSHGYNACTNAAKFVVGEDRVRVADVPFPILGPEQVVRAIDEACTSKTRLILVDHVTSPTGIILPVEEIVRTAHARGIRVLVDAAHAPGMLAVDLESVGADYTTGNLHKWVCGPKVSGFLHVREEHQSEVRPSVISHAANRVRPGRSRFLAEFDWTGTHDPTPLLAVPAALDFLGGLYPGGMDELQKRNRDLVLAARGLVAGSIGMEAPAPDEMIGSLATLPLPDGPPPEPGGIDPLQRVLFEEYGIEVMMPHWPVPGRRWIRLSAQAYNRIEDYEVLARALRDRGA